MSSKKVTQYIYDQFIYAQPGKTLKILDSEFFYQ
jgi:hypothetical protein